MFENLDNTESSVLLASLDPNNERTATNNNAQQKAHHIALVMVLRGSFGTTRLLRLS